MPVALQLTPRGVHVGDIGVVGELASPQRDSRRAAERRGAVVPLVESALVGEVLFDHGEIVHGLHVQVLVISQDEDNVGFLAIARLLGLDCRKQQACCDDRPREPHAGLGLLRSPGKKDGAVSLAAMIILLHVLPAVPACFISLLTIIIPVVSGLLSSQPGQPGAFPMGYNLALRATATIGRQASPTPSTSSWCCCFARQLSRQQATGATTAFLHQNPGNPTPAPPCCAVPCQNPGN